MFRRSPQPENSPSTPALSPRVLLAEDDLEMRRFLAAVLELGGFTVEPCADGRELLAVLERTRTVGRSAWDLVISDIHMPGASGLEALRSLAADPAAPPVILITAFCDGPTVEEAFDAGACAVLDKPFDPGLLLCRARELTTRRAG